MSYIEVRYYICETCGAREKAERFFGVRSLPKGWHGSTKGHEQCFCNDCYTAFKEIKKKRKQKEINQ